MEHLYIFVEMSSVSNYVFYHKYMLCFEIFSNKTCFDKQVIWYNKQLAAEDITSHVCVGIKSEEVVQAGDVQPSGVCGHRAVCGLTDICGHSVSSVLGHQFRAAGLLLLNGP